MKIFKLFFLFLLLLLKTYSFAEILVPMDNKQWDHLRAYGLAYYSLKQGNNIYWLLNYRGGSFLFPQKNNLVERAEILGVYYEIISSSQKQTIFNQIENNNMEKVLLEKEPKIAVYTPPYAVPWDDAVTLALNYAAIPYKTIYDEDVLYKLKNFNWLHLHHEDFTGQFGKFYATYHYAPWYQRQVEEDKLLAQKLGFVKVSKLKLEVAKKIKQFVISGGLLFAMCSAPDSLDVALAADGLDIVPAEIDGNGIDSDLQKKLNFNLTLAFENFIVDTNAYSNEISDIDIQFTGNYLNDMEENYFELFEFSAKIDYIPSMLTQDHTKIIKDFLGLTNYFNREKIKKSVIILGEIPSTNKVKYIYSPYGQGAYSFLAGHDPEDFAHLVGEAPTDLLLHKNSPGYRLILNNILFPAAKRKPKKT